MTGTALVLAGHGSHISPQTAGLVWRHVDALRALGVADEVTAAFWKEVPSFYRVFDSLTATDITVIPLFTAQGYFTQTVIPAEMGLTGPLTVRDGRTIRYASTLNEHPYLSRVVRQRVDDALRLSATSPDRAAVVIIGHSTKRNPESRKATEAQVDQVRSLGLVAEVVAVYLDDDPGIETVYDLVSAPVLIAVPYFLALGSHTTLDVPRRLSLAPGQTVGDVQGHRIYYTRPVGVEESLRDVILELARDAGAPLRASNPGSPWAGFPAAGRAELVAAISAAQSVQFGQVVLSRTEARRIGDDSPLGVITNPGDLRVRIREQPFRPLASSADLPGGWRVCVDNPAALHGVLETIYPGAVADWAARSGHGAFTVERLDQVTARQTGMYRQLDQLDAAQQAEIVARVCGRCIRQPIWYDRQDQDNHAANEIPCGEPCNLWMSQALNEITESEQ